MCEEVPVLLHQILGGEVVMLQGLEDTKIRCGVPGESGTQRTEGDRIVSTPTFHCDVVCTCCVRCMLRIMPLVAQTSFVRHIWGSLGTDR